jgi:hypothetical protein
MKKFCSMLFFLLLVIPSVYSQEFEVHFQDTVAYGQPGDFMTIAGEVINLSSTDLLRLRMIRLQNNLPTQNWASLICLGVCAPPYVDTLDWTIAAGDTGICDVNFQTDAITQGTASVLIKFTSLSGSQIETQWYTASTFTNNIENKSNQFFKEFKLFNNYPNPFNNQTIISALVNKSSKVSLQIFDILGREVFYTTREISSAGLLKFRWNGLNNNGEELSSGIYFYRVSAHSTGNINQSEIKKLTLLR